MKRIHFLDVFIILVIVAVGWVGFTKLRGASGAEQSSQASKIVYTVEDDDAIWEQTQAVQVGNKVNIGVNGADSSVVTDVSYAPAKKTVFDSIDGRYVETELPDRYALKVTCEADAAVSDMSITAGSTPIRVGAEFTVKGRGYAVSGYVIQSDLKSQEEVQ